MSNQVDSAPRSLNHEVVKISSGRLLLIDQFMLSNSQFIDAVGEALKAKDDEGLLKSIRRFGGDLLSVDSGELKVYRDPAQLLLFVSSREFENSDEVVSAISTQREEGIVATSHIFIDTRCLVFVDVDFLSKKEVASEYAELRDSDDKAARDFIRSNGGAVRYGFNRLGDELGVFKLTPGGETIYCLWPDLA